MSSPRDWRPRFEQQTARINVDDDTWLEFRRRCLNAGEHVSEILGRLVQAEVDRQRVHDVAERPATRPTERARERVDTTETPRLFE